MNEYGEMFEYQELIQKLINNGQKEFVEAFLEHDNLVYTQKDRLNKSGACRVLGYKTKQLEEAFAECKRILENDM